VARTAIQRAPSSAADLAPAFPEMERAVIGAILLGYGQYGTAECVRLLDDRCFTRPLWAACWRSIARRFDAGDPIDTIVVAHDVWCDPAMAPFTGDRRTFGNEGALVAALLGAISGFDELAGVTIWEVIPQHAPHYARSVYAAAVRRGVIEAAATAARWAYDETDDIDGMLVAVTRAFEQLDDRAARVETGDIDAIADAAEHDSAAGRAAGIPTGLWCYDEWAGGVMPGHIDVVGGYTSAGKAQPVTASVLTPTGWRAIGDLGLGDLVIGSDGRSTPVLGVYPQGEQDVWELEFGDGARARSTLDHLWQVQTRHDKSHTGRWRVMKLADIVQDGTHWGDQAKYYIPMVAPVEFDAAPLPVDPYVLGALLGDGHLQQRGGSGEVLLTTPDQEVLDSVLSRLPGIEARPTGTYDYRLVAAEGGNDNWLLGALRSLGLMGKLSHEKFIPPAYLLGSSADRLDLLRGLMDTDGTSTRDGRLSYSTSSRRLAEDVLSLIRSLGGRARIGGKKTTHRDSWTLNPTFPRRMQPFLLERKARLAAVERPKREPTRPLVAIRSVGREECVCIAVEASDGLYVTDDYVVTHNTWFACAVANGVVDAGGRVAFFTLEMPPRELYIRLLANRIGSIAYRLRGGGGHWTPTDLELKAAARTVMQGRLRVFADQRSAAAIAAMVRQSSYDLVVVDYGQLLRPPNPRMSEYEANTENARALQSLAGRARCCVMALSQISQTSQRLGDGDAVIGFKSSGAWAEVADLGLMLSKDPDDREALRIVAKKNRHGPNADSGAEARFRMDRQTGRLQPLDGPGAIMPVAAPAKGPLTFAAASEVKTW